MTKRELSQLYWLNKEIAREKQRKQELLAASTATAATITGLPHVSGIADKTAIAAQIADCQAMIEAKIQLAVVEYNKLNRFIASVDDSFMRQVLMLRYVNGLSWTAVAQKIGGGNTGDSVRKAHDRWLEKLSVLSV